MFAYALEVFALGKHIVLDLAYGLCASLLCGHEVSGRIDRNLVKLVDERSGERVDDGDLLHLVAEELDAHSVLTVSDADVDCVSTHSECSALEVSLGPAVERIHKLIQEPCHAPFLATLDVHGLLMEVGWVADTIKT